MKCIIVLAALFVLCFSLQGFLDTQFDDANCLVPSLPAGAIFWIDGSCIESKKGSGTFLSHSYVSNQLEFKSCKDNKCTSCDVKVNLKTDTCVNTTEKNHEKFKYEALSKDKDSYYVYIYYGGGCTKDAIAKVQVIPPKCNGPYKLGNDMTYIANHCNSKGDVVTSYYHSRDCTGTPYEEDIISGDCMKVEDDYFSEYSCKELY